MSISDVIEETTKTTIIKNATSTNSLTLSASELTFNEIVNASTTNQKLKISQTGLKSNIYDISINALTISGQSNDPSINQVLGVDSSGALIFKEMKLGNAVEQTGPELIAENTVLPIIINGITYYIQLFTKPPI